MTPRSHWDPCIAHRGRDVNSFIKEYFGIRYQHTLLVAGAGFDPRSTVVANLLSEASAPTRALFIQENRPNPGSQLTARAEINKIELFEAVADRKLVSVDIFSSDGAVTGGRNIVEVLAAQDFEGISDVVIDISALSVGTSFPIIRYFVERAHKRKAPGNIHIFLAHDPDLDAQIQSIPGERPSHIHGFKGGSTLDSSAAAARLWLPQLATGRKNILRHLNDFVKPHDTCPILPFPASNPRLGDLLATEYIDELESTWVVDTRNIVYADEHDPLDLYRTILRLDDLRKPVFAGAGGSLLVLSPLGSKVMALGALMAALERDLPVAHLEPIGYDLAGEVPHHLPEPNLVHIWLEGDVYTNPRPALLVR